jgi:hypothetical protein
MISVGGRAVPVAIRPFGHRLRARLFCRPLASEVAEIEAAAKCCETVKIWMDSRISVDGGKENPEVTLMKAPASHGVLDGGRPISSTNCSGEEGETTTVRPE